MINAYLNKVINKNCLEYLRGLLDESVDCCIIDEPYGVLKGHKIEDNYNYDVAKQVRLEISRILKEYQKRLNNPDAKRLIKHKDCSVDVIDDYYSIFNKSALNDFMHREDIRLSTIWSFYTDSKKNRLSFVKRKNEEKKEKLHVCLKPILLIRRLIKLFTKENDIILDCFTGSGTTALACKQENRNFLTCEIDKTYCKIAEERILNFKEDLKGQQKWLEDRGVKDFTDDKNILKSNNMLF